jgi:alpha-galactosidase
LRDLLPKEAPVKGENWDDIFSDFETKIMPGVKLKKKIILKVFINKLRNVSL